MRLRRHYVEKPWGRTDLPAIFDAPAGQRIGEVWFTGDGEQPLLAKYLFTSERLSIQVHPDDKQARDAGFKSGKSECWYILGADTGSTLGLGLKCKLTANELRAAALDGSIEHLMDWRPVRSGDFFMVPPGTIHAIGGGISLIEFQQNSDVTYRLYDYGRPRELHLDEGLAVARPEPYPDRLALHPLPDEQQRLVDGQAFVFAQSFEDEFQDRDRWIIPLNGVASSNGESAGPGECLLVPAREPAHCSGRMLIGATL